MNKFEVKKEDLLEYNRTQLIESENQQLEPIVILANSKQFYNKMSQTDRDQIIKLHYDIDQSRFRSQHVFLSGLVTGSILYAFRNIPGKQYFLRFGAGAAFLALPWYLEHSKYQNKLEAHKGDISYYNQKYDWRNDQFAKSIVYRSLGLCPNNE